MKVAIIGTGNMGGAIAAGLAKGTKVHAGHIICTARTQKTLDKIRSIDRSGNNRYYRQQHGCKGSRRGNPRCKAMADGEPFS